MQILTTLGVAMQVTPAVTAALPNSGHPYLKIFAEDLAAGNAESLVITLVPHWCASAATPFFAPFPVVVCTDLPRFLSTVPTSSLAC